MSVNGGNSVNATLYIVRHGECSANVQQKALDPLTDVLTEVGKKQAQLLGEHLKNVSFTRAYASDYPRTFDTAEIILKQSDLSKELSVQPEKRIRERDYSGVVDRAAHSLIHMMTEKMSKEGISYLKLEMPNSETVVQFENRIMEFFSDLIKDLKKSDTSDETILIVSHGLTIQRLMVLLNSRPADFGIQNWTPNIFSERLMRNTTFHKIGLKIPRTPGEDVVGMVLHPHYREHVCIESDGRVSREVKDEKNYGFIENNEEELSQFEDETTRFCKPV